MRPISDRPGRLDRLIEQAELARRSRRLPPWLAPLLLAGVLVGVGLSAMSLGLTWSQIDPLPLVAATLGGLVLIWLAGREYAVVARLAGHDAAPPEAWRVATVASIANLLPLPIGAAYRIQAIRSSGGSGRLALRGTAAAALLWVGIAATAAGLGAVIAGYVALGLSLAGAGILVLLLGRAALGVPGRRLLLPLIAVEGGFVLQALVRVVLTAGALGVELSPSQAAFFAFTSAVSSAVGVLPGGVGIWEALTASTGPLVGVAPAAGFLVSGAVRLSNLVAYGISFALLIAADRGLIKAGAPRRRPGS